MNSGFFLFTPFPAATVFEIKVQIDLLSGHLTVTFRRHKVTKVGTEIIKVEAPSLFLGYTESSRRACI